MMVCLEKFGGYAGVFGGGRAAQRVVSAKRMRRNGQKESLEKFNRGVWCLKIEGKNNNEWSVCKGK